MHDSDYLISIIGFCELWYDIVTGYYYIILFGHRLGGYDTTFKACKVIKKINTVLEAV